MDVCLPVGSHPGRVNRGRPASPQAVAISCVRHGVGLNERGESVRVEEVSGVEIYIGNQANRS